MKKHTTTYIYVIIAIIVNIIAIILWFSAMDKISNLKAENVALIEQYRDIEEENDILYSFIENLDTYKNLDDAVESSQDLMDYIQFDYE